MVKKIRGPRSAGERVAIETERKASGDFNSAISGRVDSFAAPLTDAEIAKREAIAAQARKLGPDYDAALAQVEAETALYEAGVDGLQELIGRKSSGRKSNPRGTEDPQRPHDTVNGRAKHITDKATHTGQAISDLTIVAGLPVGQAVRLLDPKRGSRAPKAFE